MGIGKVRPFLRRKQRINPIEEKKQRKISLRKTWALKNNGLRWRRKTWLGEACGVLQFLCQSMWLTGIRISFPGKLLLLTLLSLLKSFLSSWQRCVNDLLLRWSLRTLMIPCFPWKAINRYTWHTQTSLQAIWSAPGLMTDPQPLIFVFWECTKSTLRALQGNLPCVLLEHSQQNMAWVTEGPPAVGTAKGCCSNN